MSALKHDENSVFPIPYKVVPKPSSLGFKYSSVRDHPLRTGSLWLLGKRMNDGAEGLWRVHDNLYDLTEFIKRHPGGPQWLEQTRGTDITEAFESHHIYRTAEEMLPKFFARKATEPRNSPFTFKDDDFYRTLKRNVQTIYKDLPKWPRTKSKIMTDFLASGYLALSLLACYFWSFGVATAAGIFLCYTSIAAHNFFHQKDNFRMYYFDLTLLSSSSWRISHVMSHHLYTNTIQDLEISVAEPLLQYLPVEKHVFFRYISWLYSPIIYSTIFYYEWFRELLQRIWTMEFTITQLLPLVVPIVMLAITNYAVYWVAFMYLWILTVGSLLFGIIGVNAAHHHPDIFHDGDAVRPKHEMDWGIYQLDAVMDRKEITGSHFLVLTNFGDHALHHLFPTVDHGLLVHLYPIFKETCERFGIEFRMSSQLELIKGQFRQLATVVPNKRPPRPLKILTKSQLSPADENKRF